MPRVAFDAMGTDGAPSAELDAVCALLSSPGDHRAGARIGPARPRARAPLDLDLVLVGDRERLAEGLARRGVARHPRLTLHHASQVVTMDDPPAAVLRQKKDASMRVCFDLVQAGEADAVVSAGNSGAMVACALHVWKRLPELVRLASGGAWAGASRPAICASFPTRRGACVVCDTGANVEVGPPLLMLFAILGAVYARVELGRARPRVGLLSNGSEEHKGTALTRGAHELLGALPGEDLEYVGYVEGRDVFEGQVDVVATDGFTGNVLLKTAEGAGLAFRDWLTEALSASLRGKLAALLLRPALRALARKLDYAEIGGAPLLGCAGLAVVCHGASTPAALTNAILGAGRWAERGLTPRVAEALARMAPPPVLHPAAGAPPAENRSPT